mmetsp:Transcript_18023/g.35154  ORF Transcript_18023/g.35154 Transcript_18023/m.35154 type:complete len:244 (-) Transcript_18023:476-1207(-)|eukprot:6194354-Pleurochrysis_carterae.AAC.1
MASAREDSANTASKAELSSSSNQADGGTFFRTESGKVGMSSSEGPRSRNSPRAFSGENGLALPAARSSKELQVDVGGEHWSKSAPGSGVNTPSSARQILLGTLWVQHDNLPVFFRPKDVLLQDSHIQIGDKAVPLENVEYISSRTEKYELHIELKEGCTHGGSKDFRLRARTSAEFEVWLKALQKQGAKICFSPEPSSRARKNCSVEEVQQTLAEQPTPPTTNVSSGNAAIDRARGVGVGLAC